MTRQFQVVCLASAVGAVVMACGAGADGLRAAPAQSARPAERRLETLRIAAPPDGGLYLGQHQFADGDIRTFEQAIGRKVALWSPYYVMSGQEWEGPLAFDPDAALQAWREGYVVLGGAYEVTASNAPFNVDRLLRGEYDPALHRLAAEFREFGRPMFFSAAREPNGSPTLGGFGPDGTRDFSWALEQERGFEEFDPSGLPHAALYAGLGDPTACDGLERLAAAQRYYHDFFVRRERLEFLTFDTMGWAVPVVGSDIGEPADSHAYRLLTRCADFSTFYPGGDYVDWVSLTWYMLDEPGEEPTPLAEFVENLSAMMRAVRRVAPDKPVLLVEFGVPDGLDQGSARATAKARAAIEALLRQPQIHGFVMWSNFEGYDRPGSATYAPQDMLVKPRSGQARVFREAIEQEPTRFHSCIYLSDGRPIPGCVDTPR